MTVVDQLDVPAFLRLTPDERRAGWIELDTRRETAKGQSMAKIGPKELQTRALRARETRKATAAPAPAQPEAAPAATPAPTATTAAPAKESDVRNTNKTTAKSKKASKAKARTSVKSKGTRKGTKLEKIVGLLKRPEGCTTKDVLRATGWPAVSLPQQAKAAGIKLKKEKDGKFTRYRAA